MEYILSQEEYDELIKTKENGHSFIRNTLQDLCTKVADYMPIKWGWGGPDPKPWKCIISVEEEWYCDQCPVQEVCPYEDKTWSK